MREKTRCGANSRRPDPALEAKKIKLRSAISAANTFEALARDWHTPQEPRWTTVHAEDEIGSLERDVFPSLGQLPIVEIDAAMILAVLQAIERRGAIETAHRLRQRISSVFVYAFARGTASADPAASLSKALKAVPTQRRRPALETIGCARSVIAASEKAEVLRRRRFGHFSGKRASFLTPKRIRERP